jgi:hypothetical protein
LTTAAADLSVVVITPSGFDVVRKTVEHLRVQSAADRVELVLVAPDSGTLGPVGDAVDGFWGHRIVEAGPLTSTGRAMEAGFQAATAPLLSYVEEHSYPAPGWAEAVIAAHEGPWAAVGCALENANPESIVSWAMLFMDFGPAVELAEPAEVRALPPHQTTYKRAALAGHDQDVHELLEVEAILQAGLLARGDRLYMESAARRAHLNVTRTRSMLHGQFLAGLQYAPLRIRQEGFSVARRLAYAGAAPLILVVQLRRCLGEIARTGRTRQLVPRILPAMVAGLGMQQAGETVGFLTGRQAGAPAGRLSVELDRASHI